MHVYLMSAFTKGTSLTPVSLQELLAMAAPSSPESTGLLLEATALKTSISDGRKHKARLVKQLQTEQCSAHGLHLPTTSSSQAAAGCISKG